MSRLRPKLICVIFIMIQSLIFFPHITFSQSSQENRRIEEKKRTSISTPQKITQKSEEENQIAQSIRQSYLKKLLSQKTARQADLLNVLVILFQMDEQKLPLSEQLDWFVQNTPLTQEEMTNLELEEPIKRNEAAKLIIRALDMKGGIWLRLFPNSPRYALKEANFHGLLPYGMPQDYLSGLDLVYFLMNATDYLIKKHAT